MEEKQTSPLRLCRFLVASRWSSVVCLTTILLQLLLGITIVPTTMAEDYYTATTSTGNDTVDLSDLDLDGMSIMPLACVNTMGGYMMKFEIFESKYNFQCHVNSIGTYVVTISNYMRHYFNYQSLLQGSRFTLPSDAGYLNCVQLEQSTNTNLYARIGCLEHEHYTSTKLSLHIYTDKKCSVPFDDGQSDNERLINGYILGGEYFQTQVSFRPPFFSCESCNPHSIVNGFSKQNAVWFDDDAPAKYKYFDDWIDDYVPNDDAYAALQPYVNNERKYAKEDDDVFYTMDDNVDDGERKRLLVQEFTPAKNEFEKFEQEFWREHRELSYDVYATGNDTINDTLQTWNMCTKIHAYSTYCDQDCQSFDSYRIDEWPYSSVVQLAVIWTILASTMCLILVNRSRAFEKASIYADDFNAPQLGILPHSMGILFLSVLVIIGILAGLRLVYLTLLVAGLCCLLSVTYLLNITFREGKKPGYPNSEDDKVQSNYNNILT